MSLKEGKNYPRLLSLPSKEKCEGHSKPPLLQFCRVLCPKICKSKAVKLPKVGYKKCHGNLGYII